MVTATEMHVGYSFWRQLDYPVEQGSESKMVF